MENNHTALKEAFNREIVTPLRFLLKGDGSAQPSLRVGLSDLLG